MAAEHSENLHKLLESFQDDLQDLNLTLQRKLIKQLEELVGPQEISIREEIAAFEREKAEVEEIATRISEWMENVNKQFKEQLKEEIATSQPEHLAAFGMYLGHDFEAELDEAVNGLKSTTEQPRGDGFGKDLMKKIFTMQLEIHAAAQSNLDELKKVLKKLERRKEWVENTEKQLQELKGMIELVQNALVNR
uniref:uncharacterized protein LOC105351532 n=1 Tax=Fragaria vesca subsp. vesca TaxID=101020 RepID=UPI0005CA7CB1|nr:PREDICTED: uncharacterized protein LOC105351532 [Fragaria vesca subsp. vesca]